MKDVQRIFKIISATILTFIVFGVSSFFLWSIFSNHPVSWKIFFQLILSLGFISSCIIFWFWRIKENFSKNFQFFMLLWSGIVVWYWIFAPIFYLFTMNLDPQQIAITGFAFAWEVPIIGGLFILVSLMRFRNFNKVITEKKEIKNPDSFYNDILRYPRDTAILIYLFSFTGYLLGSVQLYYFGLSPQIELIKNSFLGLVVASFLALFYYLTIDIFLNDTFRDVEKRFKLNNVQTRKLSSEILSKSLLVVVGSLAFLSLIAYNSWQVLIIEKTKGYMEQISYQMKTDSGFDINFGFDEIIKGQYGNNSGIVILEKGEYFMDDKYKPHVLQEINYKDEGFVESLRGSHKIIYLTTHLETGEKMLIKANLTNSFGIIGSASIPFVTAIIFILFIIIVVSILISLVLTRSVRYILNMIKDAEEKDVDDMEPLPYVNELSDLSHILIDYLKREKQLHESERDFISLTSHQLRTPLASMKWVLELLSSKGELGEKEREYIRSLETEIERLSALSSLLLDVSRAETGKGFKVNPKKLELKSLINNTLEGMILLAKEKDIDMKLDPKSEDVEVASDQNMIKDILHPMLNNAIQYTPKGGNIEIYLTRKKDLALIKIKDSGVGISEEDLRTIFDKFSRSRKAQLLNPEGTGLGLYLSKRLAKMLGGDIEVDSEEGKGTTFSISIPIKYQE